MSYITVDTGEIAPPSRRQQGPTSLICVYILFNTIIHQLQHSCIRSINDGMILSFLATTNNTPVYYFRQRAFIHIPLGVLPGDSEYPNIQLLPLYFRNYCQIQRCKIFTLQNRQLLGNLFNGSGLSYECMPPSIAQ